MHSMSDNIKFTPYNDGNEVVNELFQSLCSKYQDNLETSMRGSDFVFDSVQFMYYKCHQVKFKRGGSNIDSRDWIKNKNEEINYPSKIDDWKKFERNNPITALNILCIKEKKILPAYISKHNPNH